MQNERIAESMEPILPQFVLLCDALIDWTCADVTEDGGMKRRIEVSNAFCMRQNLGYSPQNT